MPDPTTVGNATGQGQDYTVLTDEVTDGTLGTGKKQLVGIVDATIDSTNKLVVDSNGAARTKEQRAGTPSQSSVASSASNVTLLASNANRLGATIYNDSTQNLFLKLGATASSSSFTVLMAPNSYYELPYGYTGQVDGIWASANGNARLTELAA